MMNIEVEALRYYTFNILRFVTRFSHIYIPKESFIKILNSGAYSFQNLRYNLGLIMGEVFKHYLFKYQKYLCTYYSLNSDSISISNS